MSSRRRKLHCILPIVMAVCGMGAGSGGSAAALRTSIGLVGGTDGSSAETAAPEESVRHRPGKPAFEVKNAPKPQDMEAYLFVYFTGNTVDGEKLRFAVSNGNDALHWSLLNGGQPVLESAFGTRGLRDPFIMRSAKGDRFFLMATDLSTGRSGWTGSTSHGSRHLEIWESTDLVHWGPQRHVQVNGPNAGMTWAPEASYDPSIDAYVVYWTSSLFTDEAHRQGDGDGPQILYSITRDFRTFETPKPWFKAADLPGLVKQKGMIDTTVMKDGNRYYRFTKVTDASGCPSADIIAQRSTSLRSSVASRAWSTVDRCIGRKAGTPEVEGPSAFVANKHDASGFRYFLWVDDYGGVGYIPLATNSLEGTVRWTYPRSFDLPTSPRHGSVLPITAAERDALVARWGSTSLARSRQMPPCAGRQPVASPASDCPDREGARPTRSGAAVPAAATDRKFGSTDTDRKGDAAP